MRCTVVAPMPMAMLLSLSLLGCGGGDRTAAPEGSSPAEAIITQAGLKRYETSDLPAVDKSLSVIEDQGAVEIAPPAEWATTNRQKGYLVVYVKGKVNELPRLSATVADSPFGNSDTTEDNAEDLAKGIKMQLEKDKKRVRENPKPLMLGGRAWVRHVRLVTQGGTPCAVQSLQILRGGRLYTIELISAAKSEEQADIAAAVKKYRDQAYAVAANVRFIKEAGFGAPPAEDKPAAEKAAEKPAEKPPGEKPAETKPEEKKNE